MVEYEVSETVLLFPSYVITVLKKHFPTQRKGSSTLSSNQTVILSPFSACLLFLEVIFNEYVKAPEKSGA